MRSALFGPYRESAWTGPSSSGSSPGRDADRVHPALQRAPATSGPRPRGAGAGAHHRSVAPRRHSLAAACSADSSTSTTSWPRSPSASPWRLVDSGRRPRSCANDHRVRQRGGAHHQYWLTSQRAPLRGLGNSPDQTPASHAECLQRDRGFGALHHGEVATPPFVQGGAEAVPRDSQCPAHHCEPPVGHCIPPPCAGTTDSSCPIVHP
jgi:hypothetical protein